MILNRDVSGEMTSIPLRSVALRGNIGTTMSAMTSPISATNKQIVVPLKGRGAPV